MKQEKNINDKKVKDYILNKVGMWLQIITVILILIFGIRSIFNASFMKYCILSTGVALIIMAYNNYRIYKRKSFTLLYIIIGIMTLVYGVMEFIK